MLMIVALLPFLKRNLCCTSISKAASGIFIAALIKIRKLGRNWHVLPDGTLALQYIEV
jgi:hypothetical protein